MVRKRTGTNRFLPKHVSKFESQHGTVRYRFRKAGLPSGYFTAKLGSEEFRAEYQAFLNPADLPKPEPVIRAAKGTIDELLDRYMSVPERLGPTKITQDKIRAVLEDFRRGDTAKGRGWRMVAPTTFEDIDKIVAKKLVKTGTGNKTKGGVHAARKLRKELVRLFDFAEKSGMIARNPARLSEKVKAPAAAKSHGFHTWTEEEIERYRAYHELGTRARLAMELALWTDQRRSDVVSMGRAQIQNGRLPVTQEKTGEVLWLPVAPQLLEAIVAMKPGDTSPFCFLITERGRPFKNAASFGTWFKKQCVASGLPHCTMHGLRKATLRRMAELRMTNKDMKSVSGQRSDKTLAKYIEMANQKRLADAAMKQLSAWETSVRTDASGLKDAVND
ncbi:tyrosine-type recombinase/integrase [Novosphingobium sp. FGD1]|jgi:integrase|uniref:Tyrosine-type recombinase/integrase n=1 Tax=Novosphingobium silvae TaxID=2692619 RepID=A0A7X4GF00_9SPHN|nr:tyrosine-type recombinase/integrase [Novosphingobium silvae]MYL97039.1 tyrosine-type recombinase/integrase [Novosphingobium silvae]